jgi:DNA primase
MEDTAKYLIHATFTADGVVERSDVVGAIFGQTEGLLGEQLDLRELQQSSKVGRIDVEVDVTHGQAEGTVTIASGLDRVATATLAASLETLTRIGPCQARCEVTDIEDVRAAKRRRVVERAKELLNTAFDDSVMSSDEILREVREHVRVEDVTEYEGFPAGPRVADSDAIIVVEGRSDVLQLLKYGIKNAVAVEGTNVPEVVADLTAERTVTAFLDGDRGGDLILRELADVGDVDYVALAPAEKSVEDLSHHEVFDALREKVPYSVVADASDPREAAIAATDGSATEVPADGQEQARSTDGSGAEPAATTPEATVASTDGASTADATVSSPASDENRASADAASAGDTAADDAAATATDAVEGDAETDVTDAAADADGDSDGDAAPSAASPTSLREHVTAVIGEGTGQIRLLDGEFGELASASAEDAFELVRDAAMDPHAIVLDGELDQKVLDVAAQRGASHVVAATLGDFVKRPTSVRVRTAADLAVE